MTLDQAVEEYLAADAAFKAFERDNPNDATKRWDAVFDAKCDAFDQLRRVFLEEKA